MLPLNLLREVAARQHGLVTPEQAYEVGFDERSLRHATLRGHLRRMTPTLLMVPGAPDTRAQRMMAAVLDAGRSAALTHGAAAQWWGVPGFARDPLQVGRHRDDSNRPHRLSVVHEPRLWSPDHIRVLEGVPVVVPALIPFQLANAGEHLRRVERYVDNAWSRNLLNHWTLVAMRRTLSARGRRGLSLVDELIAVRGPDYVPPASNLEARFARILDDAGLPPMDRQVNTSDETGWIGRVDFRARDLPLIAEVQSERFHSSLVDSRGDIARMKALRAAGFVVVEVVDLDVWHRKDKVVADMWDGVRKAHRRAA